MSPAWQGQTGLNAETQSNAEKRREQQLSANLCESLRLCVKSSQRGFPNALSSFNSCNPFNPFNCFGYGFVALCVSGFICGSTLLFAEASPADGPQLVSAKKRVEPQMN